MGFDIFSLQQKSSTILSPPTCRGLGIGTSKSP